MDITKLKEHITNLKLFFDEIVFFAIDDKKKVYFDENGRFVVEDLEDSRENALILNNALRLRKRLVKLDIINGRTYQTITKYCQDEGKNYVLQVGFEVGDNVVVSAQGTGEFVNTILAHNTKMYKDALTKVYNRSYFESHLMGTDVNAFAMIDVDDFKNVNDSYGHEKGDEVLRKIANIIEKSVDDCGTVVRYGGDEFVVVFHEVEKTEFVGFLKNICNNVKNLKFDDIDLKTSVSVGGVYGFGNIKDLIWKADMLMYAAKKEKNSYVFANADEI